MCPRTAYNNKRVFQCARIALFTISFGTHRSISSKLIPSGIVASYLQAIKCRRCRRCSCHSHLYCLKIASFSWSNKLESSELLLPILTRLAVLSYFGSQPGADKPEEILILRDVSSIHEKRKFSVKIRRRRRD